MNVLYIVALSIGSIIELFILCKLMGYRQLSQLSMFDYINGITIGNIAAEMATSIEDDFYPPMIAMVIYAAATILLSWISSKSIHARRLLSGKSVILMDNGKLFEENLKKSKIDLNEFLTQCRINGYFDLSQLQTVLLEQNGHMSFLPKNDFKPLTPKDMNLSLQQEHLVTNIIIDGKVLPKNLKSSGKDERWLERELHNHGVHDIQDVFLATLDLNQKFTIFTHTTNEYPPDLLN